MKDSDLRLHQLDCRDDLISLLLPFYRYLDPLRFKHVGALCLGACARRRIGHARNFRSCGGWRLVVSAANIADQGQRYQNARTEMRLPLSTFGPFKLHQHDSGRAADAGRAARVPSLRERSSLPAHDVQDKADDRENNQDVDSGGRNVEEPESRDPGDTKNDGEQKQHGGPLRMMFRTLRLWDADGSLRLGHTSKLVTPLTAISCRARIVRTIGK